MRRGKLDHRRLLHRFIFQAGESRHQEVAEDFHCLLHCRASAHQRGILPGSGPKQNPHSGPYRYGGDKRAAYDNNSKSCTPSHRGFSYGVPLYRRNIHPNPLPQPYLSSDYSCGRRYENTIHRAPIFRRSSHPTPRFSGDGNSGSDPSRHRD